MQYFFFKMLIIGRSEEQRLALIFRYEMTERQRLNSSGQGVAAVFVYLGEARQAHAKVSDNGSGHGSSK